MNNNYIWSISIIAQYDESVKAEYEELEYCVLTNNDYHLRFTIFKYNQNTKEAWIKVKKQEISGNDFFETIELGKIDFFGNGHKSIVEYLKKYVRIINRKVDCVYKTMLITWGHGAGIGFFYTNTNAKEITSFLDLDIGSEAMTEKILKSIMTVQHLKSGLSLEDDYINYYWFYKEFGGHVKTAISESLWIDKIKVLARVITVRDFNKIIKSGLGAVDILITMNCYMQMIETCFSLRNVVKLIVAPQSTITFWGYNYYELFQLLGNFPESPEQVISKNITCYYSAKYFNKAPQMIDPLTQVSLSCIKLDSLDFSFINRIATFFNNQLWTEFDVGSAEPIQLYDLIGAARVKCNSPYLAILDLKHFFNQLRILIESGESPIKKELEDLIIEFDNIRHNSLLSIYQPGLLHEPDKSGASMSPQFVSIFFPFENREVLQFFNDQYGYKKLIKNKPWGIFLENVNPKNPT